MLVKVPVVESGKIMKKLIIILLMSMTFFTVQSQAVEQNLPTQIQTSFDQKIKKFYPTFQSAAKGLLYSLAVISIVLTFSLMAVRGELEITGAVAQLIKYALIVGFFSTLINSPSWFKNIYEGFDAMGASAGGDKFDNIINNIFSMWDSILNKASIWKPAEAIGFFLAGIAATLAITILVGQALMIYGFTVMSIYLGVFWLGFGVFEQTRQWAINSIVNVVRLSAKWMMMLILISIALGLVDDVLNKGFEDFNSIITLFVISMMMVTISSGISAFVDGYFSGFGGGDNNRGMQMASSFIGAGAGAVAGGVAGGLAGAKGASDTIAAAKATNGGSAGVGAGLKSAGQFAGGMAGGMADGASKGIGGLAKDWASGGKKDNTPQPDKNKDWSNQTSSVQPREPYENNISPSNGADGSISPSTDK